MKVLVIHTVYPLNEKGERQEPVSFKGSSDAVVKVFGDTMYPAGYEVESVSFNLYQSMTGAIEQIMKPMKCRRVPPCGIGLGSTEKFCPFCAHQDSVARSPKKG